MACAAPWTAAAQTLTADNCTAALRLHRAFATYSGDDNFLFSPYALQAVLSMLYAAAEGQTRTAISNAMHWSQAPIQKSAAHRELEAVLATHLAAHRGVQLHTASRLWADSRLHVRQDYALCLQRDFKAPLAQLDIASAPEAARGTINAWVSAQTSRHIVDLLAPGALTTRPSIVPTAAMHISATWPRPLGVDSSAKTPFWGPHGNKMYPRTILTATTHLPHVVTPDLQAVRLPYANRHFSLFMVMPAKSIASFLDKYTDADAFMALQSRLETAQVKLKFPAFTVAQTLPGTRQILESLGMDHAFGPKARFDVATNVPTILGDIYDKTYIRVDERGTEAAAAAAAPMLATAIAAPSQPAILTFDRPFIFFVINHDARTILFSGNITQPTISP